jgi:hypothetical protein
MSLISRPYIVHDTINENVEHLRNENSRGKPKYYERTCPTAAFSTTNPIQSDLGANQAHLGSQRSRTAQFFIPFHLYLVY